jgi:hypothetical protein
VLTADEEAPPSDSLREILNLRLSAFGGAGGRPLVGEMLHLLEDEVDGFRSLIRRVVVASQEALARRHDSTNEPQ